MTSHLEKNGKIVELIIFKLLNAYYNTIIIVYKIKNNSTNNLIN